MPKTKYTTIYVKAPVAVIARVRARQKTLGYPHTMTSVFAQALERGIDAIEADERKVKES